MKTKTCKFLAAAAILALGFATNTFTSQAAGTDAGNWDRQLVRQMDQLEQRMDAMEQRMDRDMAAQRQFFANWMDNSMIMPDPFARIWQDRTQNLENMQTQLAAMDKDLTPSSSMKLTGANGSSMMQLSTWSSGKPADTDISYAVSNQTLDGDMTANGTSSMKLALRDKTYFKGAFNRDRKARAASIALDKDAVWEVTGTSYVTALTDADTTLANIHSNGHTIYYDAKNSENAWLKGGTRTLPGGGKLMPATAPSDVQTDVQQDITDQLNKDTPQANGEKR